MPLMIMLYFSGIRGRGVEQYEHASLEMSLKKNYQY